MMFSVPDVPYLWHNLSVKQLNNQLSGHHIIHFMTMHLFLLTVKLKKIHVYKLY